MDSCTSHIPDVHGYKLNGYGFVKLQAVAGGGACGPDIIVATHLRLVEDILATQCKL